MRTFTVLLTALFLTLFASPMLAAENYSDLMNRAGMQRMLSQRIAKAYLYNGQGISQQEASHQLNIAVTRFEYNHAALKKINDSATQELLGLVESIFSSYKSLVTKPYKKESSATVLELSEQLLEVSQNVVLKLQELSGAKIDDIINLSGRQRMLSQRIAKYYIAYQAGFQDENSVQQLETAVSEFQAALKLLTEEKRNTERITLLLHKMQMLWERVAPYFLKIREKGNPSLVLTSTDDINQLADEVTALYVEVSAAAAKIRPADPSRAMRSYFRQLRNTFQSFIMIQSRIHKLQASLRSRNLDAVLITEPANRRYLSSYTAADHGIQESSGVLLIPKNGRPWLLTDSRFELQAKEEAQGFKVELYRKGLAALLKMLLPDLGVRRLGFESHYFLHAAVGRLEKALAGKVELVPLTGLVERMREVKSEEEISLIRQSVRLNERIFQQVSGAVAPGMTEIEVALAIERAMRENGAERPSFDTIVAFGSNAAKPHAVPTDRVLREGEIVLIDMGLILNGWCSDMTRTLFVGKPDSLFLERLRAVRKAQFAAVKVIRAGAVCREVDQAARQVLDEEGMGKAFGHSLGHGVGLAVHEPPSLNPRNRKQLHAGMIVTIEPGVYYPGWGGIRLENMAVVREDGCELLNEDSTGLDL